MSRHNLQILIFDNGMELCHDLGSWLKKDGHAVTCLAAKDFWTTDFSEVQPNLIIYELLTGSGDELSLYRRVRSRKAFRQLPVIVVSENSGLEYEMLDILDFQTRPFDRARFLNTIKRIDLEVGAKQLCPLTPAQLQPFKAFLLTHSGLHFSQHNLRMLERGLLRRMQTLQITRPDDYFGYLESTANNYDELNKLLGLLTVGETCFFRYRAHREALLHFVLPQIITHNQKQKKLRIWSAGCSTGEEPYSLAILLQEHFPELADWDVQIIATDINKRALRQAREGVYGPRSLRLVEDSLRRRYFRQAGGYYQLQPRIRKLVHFSYLNLQTVDSFPAPSDATDNLDLLLCRNVLIYFELGTIRRIVEQFSANLKPSGFLFMGHAETMQNVSDRFKRLDHHGSFFYQLKPPEPALVEALAQRKPQAAAVSPPKAPATTRSAKATAPASPGLNKVQDQADRLYTAAMSAFEHEFFEKANQLFDEALNSHPKHPPSLVGKGLLMANQGDYAAANKYCAQAIAQNDLLPEAYMLRGLVLDMQGHLERALVEFQKVLWLDGHFIMAHYLMAKIHGRLDRPAQASRSLRNTISSLERLPGQEIIPFSGGLSRSVFLEIAHREFAEKATNP